MPEAGAVEVPEDLDPAEVLSLVFTYMTAYQVLHRTAMAKRGETVLGHGAAGRVGTDRSSSILVFSLFPACSYRTLHRDRVPHQLIAGERIVWRGSPVIGF